MVDLSNKASYPFFMRTVPSYPAAASWHFIMKKVRVRLTITYLSEPYAQGLMFLVFEQTMLEDEAKAYKDIQAIPLPFHEKSILTPSAPYSETEQMEV